MKSCENCRYRKIDEKSLPCSACIDLGQDLSGWVGMKNADRIRAMTDEELAVFLGNTKAFCCRDCDPSEEFIAEFKTWLKEEETE